MLDDEEMQKKLDIVGQLLFDKKAANIIALDVRGISSVTDYLLIADGCVERHVAALGRAIREQMLAFGSKPLHVEGEGNGDWLVLDYGEIVFHLFIPSLRVRYALEQVWKEGSVVDLAIVLSESAQREEKRDE